MARLGKRERAAVAKRKAAIAEKRERVKNEPVAVGYMRHMFSSNGIPTGRKMPSLQWGRDANTARRIYMTERPPK